MFEIPARGETLTQYRCPKCRAPVTSGIKQWEGDYDDWEVKPHCSECMWEATSAKRPFEDALPESDLPPVTWVMWEAVTRQRTVMLMEGEIEQSAPPGGRMWQGATLIASGRVQYQRGETTAQFQDRAWREARKFMEKQKKKS